MELFRFKSMPRQTPFAPEWHYILAEDMIQDIDYDKVAEIILSKEKEIVDAFPGTSDAYTGLGEDSLTSRFKHFNLFSWTDPEINKLKEEIHEKYKLFLIKLGLQRSKVWIQCWANVLRDGQEIKPHIHSVTPFSYLGGHICIQCDKTSTVYINPVNQINEPELFDSPNAVGKFTIFQDCIPHYTTTHNGSKERITIAFDLFVDRHVQDLSTEVKANLILFDNI